MGALENLRNMNTRFDDLKILYDGVYYGLILLKLGSSHVLRVLFNFVDGFNDMPSPLKQSK